MNQAIENSTNSATTNSVYSAGSEDSGFFDPEDILTPDDLLTFAWQIASGMVNTIHISDKVKIQVSLTHTATTFRYIYLIIAANIHIIDIIDITIL